jgi:hypothetical protein
VEGANPKPNTLAGTTGRHLPSEKTTFARCSRIQPILGYGRTFSISFTLETAPFGAVAVTTNGYSPGFVAAPPGDFGKLLHAELPSTIIISTAKDSAHRGRRLNIHIAPHSDMLASNKAIPPPNPPGNVGSKFGTNPLQNVFTTIATLIAFPVKVMVPGTMSHVMFGEMLVHPSVTVPVVPGNAVSVNPNTALLPGVVFTVDGLPGAIPIVTGEFPLLNVAVTVSAALIVTEHPPVPVHPAPLQPANVDPLAAVAVSATTWPLVKLAEHVVGQLIPAGLLVTVPVPVPASFTLKVKLFVL